MAAQHSNTVLREAPETLAAQLFWPEKMHTGQCILILTALCPFQAAYLAEHATETVAIRGGLLLPRVDAWVTDQSHATDPFGKYRSSVDVLHLLCVFSCSGTCWAGMEWYEVCRAECCNENTIGRVNSVEPQD
jgi:hypothetical protein